MIWAASRQGLHGAVLAVFVLQLCIITLVKWTHAVDIQFYELQLLDAVLALVGFLSASLSMRCARWPTN